MRGKSLRSRNQIPSVIWVDADELGRKGSVGINVTSALLFQSTPHIKDILENVHTNYYRTGRASIGAVFDNLVPTIGRLTSGLCFPDLIAPLRVKRPRVEATIESEQFVHTQITGIAEAGFTHRTPMASVGVLALQHDGEVGPDFIRCSAAMVLADGGCVQPPLRLTQRANRSHVDRTKPQRFFSGLLEHLSVKGA
jgi:hypothetical protein